MHKTTKELKLTEEEIKDLKVIFDEFWKEDIDVRMNLLAKWRRLKFFWNNITNVWYDSVAHDWRIWNAENLDGGNDDGSQGYYDQRVNVFRAYLESIIAALSVTVPPVKCYPDDAELASDLETAKAGDKIAELIYRHNDATLLWLHSLYVYMTEGFVAAHTHADFNKEYGTYPMHEYDEDIEVHEIVTCPHCQFEISDNVVDPNEPEAPPEVPDAPIETTEQPESELDLSQLNESSEVTPQMMGMQDVCPSCYNIMVPEVNRINEIKKVWVGTTQEPKGRVKLNAYGGLNIKIPLYARTQEECIYLYYSYETHYARAIQMYPDLYEKLHTAKAGSPRTGYDSWEQWARLSTEYRTGSFPVNNVTVKAGWFKPDCYNVLEEDRAKHWKRKYPNGIHATFVNEDFACAKKQELDKHWTLTINPLADFLQNDPIAMMLVSIQEITNDIVSLTKQTLEHGVGLTFVDPQFIDLNAYGQTEVLPGSLIPTKTISGNKKLQDGIYEVKTATLSGEVMPFAQQIQHLGQLVSGALPALYGEMNSETASQDSMSKNQAVARLGTVWKMISAWWKNTFGKAIPLYIELIQVDERDVKRRKDGSFINVLIRRSELSGKIGKVELEANENIPLTWSQRKDVIMQLLLSPNPELLKMLMAPENLDMLREAIGINGFYVTGEDDRDKQYVEIQQLLESAPIDTGMPMMNEMGMPTGEMQQVPSVEVDPIMDNHIIQFEICRKWAVSEAGQLAKIENEEGYKNVLLHAKQHLDILNLGDGQPQQNALPGGENGAEPQEKPKQLPNNEAPMTGDSNASVH